MDWQRLDDRWRCQDAVVMCLDLSPKLGDSARRRIVTRKCNEELRARSLPTAASPTIYVVQKHDVANVFAQINYLFIFIFFEFFRWSGTLQY